MSRSLTQLHPGYRTSWALVIGINRYRNMPPLNCAASDAEAVAETLIDRFEFPRDHVVLLQDEQATQNNILSVFDAFAAHRVVAPDDRIMVYFAGHGVTRETRDGSMVGYIAPIDAEPRAWRTLIRMTDLISQARFLPAKHILFILDACYSGLSLRRSSPFDESVERFLTRPAVQVMTAGRADEMVVDGGDREGDNSIFTGYLLEALAGAAATASGLMTASDVMSYVYRHVTENPYIDQTPQYGWLDGDGDFVFQTPHAGALPVPVELALRQGSVANRMATVSDLTEMAITPGRNQALAVNRLHDIALMDPDPRVSHTAGRVLGLEANNSNPPRIIVHPPKEPVKPPTPREPQSEKSPVMWIVAALSILVLGIGIGLAAFGILMARSQPEIAESPATTQVSASLPIQMEPTTEVPPTDAMQPSPQPTSTVVLGTPLFTDDFSGALTNWEAFPENSSVSRISQNGQMQFSVYSKYSLWMTHANGVSIRDGQIATTATVLSGQSRSNYGIVFRQIDLDNYYFYQVTANGEYNLILQNAGSVRFIVGPKPLKYAAFDGHPHTLEVRLNGSEISLYFDGELLETVQDGTISSGKIGLAIQALDAPPVSIAFDRFDATTP